MIFVGNNGGFNCWERRKGAEVTRVPVGNFGQECGYVQVYNLGHVPRFKQARLCPLFAATPSLSTFNDAGRLFSLSLHDDDEFQLGTVERPRLPNKKKNNSPKCLAKTDEAM
jgi:hypothetical protein